MALKLWTSKPSGNAYKVRLLCAQIPREVELVELEIFAGAARTPEFRARNPFGRVPFLQDGDFTLAESNAILLYLARGTPFLPEDPRKQALVHQWLFFEQNQIEPGLGIPRFYALKPAERDATLDAAFRVRGVNALKTLERYLKTRDWLVDRYSIADLALFAYTHASPEGGFDLQPFPAVRAWLDRVRATPRFIPM